MAITKAFALVHDNVMNQLPGAIQAQEGGVLRGGYSWVGSIGQWNAVLLVTTEARLDTVENAAGNNALVLVRMTEDRGELDIDINQAALTRLNTWLQARGIEVESRAQARTIIRKLFRRFLNRFESELVDVN
jgi:hypothetical protein